MRKSLLACMLLIAAPCLASQIGASVQNISLDPSKSTATVRMLNSSSKDISAYTLAIDLSFANGKTIHDERLEDYLPIPENAKKLWHPGTSRELVVPAGTSTPIAKTEAKVVAIIYADRTADVDNEAAYQRMIDSRKGRAAAMAEVVKALRTAVANSAGPHPSEKASNSIKQLLYEAKASGSGDMHGELTVALQTLQDAPKAAARLNVNEADYLTAYATEMNRLVSVSAEQAVVRRNP